MTNFLNVKLNECFVNVFSTLNANGLSTFFEQHNLDIDSCDLEYIIVHSGLKTVNRLVSNFCDKAYEEDFPGLGKSYVSPFFKKSFTAIIRTRFESKWNRLFDTLNIQYEATHPYEITSTNSGADVTVSSDHSTSSNNNSNSGFSKTDNISKSEDNVGVYGFNSVNSVNSDVTNRKEEIVSDYVDGGNSHGDSENSKDSTSTLTRGTVNRKVGNLGNYATQDLIDKEFKLRRLQILDIIYADIDSVITRSIYD